MADAFILELQSALPQCITDLLKLTQKPESASFAGVLQSFRRRKNMITAQKMDSVPILKAG